MHLNFSKTDFPGCEWISAGNYKGIQNVDGRDCIVFEDKLTVTRNEESPATDTPEVSQINVSAHIDLETRLPVSLSMGSETMTFQYGEAPQSNLTLPENVQAAIDARDTAMKNLTSSPPTPFAAPIPPIPTGQLLKRAPDFSQWVISYFPIVNKGAGQAGKPEVSKRVFITKTGPIRQVITVESNGNRTELWFKGEMEIVCLAAWKNPWITEAHDPHNPFPMDFSKTDFPECHWISARNYKGIQKVQDRDCIVFGDQLTVTSETPHTNPSATTPPEVSQYNVSAYVDLETRLPVIEATPGETVTYQFAPPPQAMLAFPKEHSGRR